jgi:hypothetical protein
MNDYTYITLREKRQLKDPAAEWFHSKWEFHRKLILNVWMPILIMKPSMDGIFA